MQCTPIRQNKKQMTASFWFEDIYDINWVSNFSIEWPISSIFNEFLQQTKAKNVLNILF